MQNEVHMQAFKTLGVLPTPMAFPELFTALQQGTVDGQENPIPVIVSGKFSQVQKYLSLTGHVYSPALFLMSPAVWNKLSEPEKAMFKEAALVGAKANRAEVARVEQNGIETLRSQGMQVVTDVDRAKFEAALKPAFDDYAKKFGQANLDRIRNYKG
jgi:TRAP-type C4-dicarboxylate transport system substrate-binding protein